MFKSLILLLCYLMIYQPVFADTPQPLTAEIQQLLPAQAPAQSYQLEQGIKLLFQGKPQEAIAGYFSKISDFFEKKQHAAPKTTFYTARTLSETLVYLAYHQEKANHKEAVVLSAVWSDAYYMTGYAWIELANFKNAKFFLNKAIKLAPFHSQYISELAHIYQEEKQWHKAFELFEQAESAAELSPLDTKNKELTRAKRGMGFALIELHEFVKAIQKYQECLAIDKNDKIALHELNYIKRLLNQQNPPPIHS